MSDARRWTTWLRRTTATAAPGVVVATYVLGLWDVVALAVPVTALVAITYAVAGTSTGRTFVEACRRVVLVSACAMSVLTCAALVAQWNGGMSLALLVALLGTTPVVRAAVARRLPPRASGRAAPASRAVDGSEQASLPSLSDRELRRAWEASALELRRRPDAGRCIALVITRQHLLDEIWSRDRAALEAWVACGARSRPCEPYPDP